MAGATLGVATPVTVDTMALLPGSPALDAGANTFDDQKGNPVLSDQRGISRDPAEGSSDIGAFQSQGFNVTITAGNNQSTTVNSPFSTALGVHVTANDSGLTNLSGGIVTFIAPSTGATAVLGTNQLISDPVTLSSGGTATSDTFTADDVTGTYNVMASATPYATSSFANFALTNGGTPTAGLPTLSITGATTATGGLSYTLTLNTSDATQNIPLTWTIQWGDAQVSTATQNNDALTTVTLTDGFATAPENFTIFATATDGNGNIYVAGTWQVNEDDEEVRLPPGPVQAEAMSTDLVDLTWNAVAGAQYYEVFRGNSPNFTPSYNNDVSNAVIAPSFADSNLSAGTTYDYKVYAIDASGAAGLVGASSAATPLFDAPIDPGSGADSTPSGAPVDIQAMGVNDLEIFVSWTCTARNIDGFQIQISTDQVNWGDAGDVPAFYTDLTASSASYIQNYVVRTGPNGSDLLQEGQKYYIRVRSYNSGYQSAWDYSSGPAEVVTPSVDVGAGMDTVLVFGGNDEPMTRLLQGVSVGLGGVLQGANPALDGVGAVWVHDVNEGYNAFLTADPHDGGAPSGYGGMPPPGAVPAYEDIINNNGTGLLYTELQTELNRGYYDLGLIGYSHGVGIMGNMMLTLVNDPATPFFTTGVFVGTIDGVEYGAGPDSSGTWLTPRDGWYIGPDAPVVVSPAALWPTTCTGVNYWEPNWYDGIVGGSNMLSATNYEIDFLTHSNIDNSSGVLSGIENAMDSAFN